MKKREKGKALCRLEKRSKQKKRRGATEKTGQGGRSEKKNAM